VTFPNKAGRIISVGYAASREVGTKDPKKLIPEMGDGFDWGLYCKDDFGRRLEEKFDVVPRSRDLWVTDAMWRSKTALTLENSDVPKNEVIQLIAGYRKWKWRALSL